MINSLTRWAVHQPFQNIFIHPKPSVNPRNKVVQQWSHFNQNRLSFYSTESSHQNDQDSEKASKEDFSNRFKRGTTFFKSGYSKFKIFVLGGVASFIFYVEGGQEDEVEEENKEISNYQAEADKFVKKMNDKKPGDIKLAIDKIRSIKEKNTSYGPQHVESIVWLNQLINCDHFDIRAEALSVLIEQIKKGIHAATKPTLFYFLERSLSQRLKKEIRSQPEKLFLHLLIEAYSAVNEELLINNAEISFSRKTDIVRNAELINNSCENNPFFQFQARCVYLAAINLPCKPKIFADSKRAVGDISSAIQKYWNSADKKQTEFPWETVENGGRKLLLIWWKDKHDSKWYNEMLSMKHKEGITIESLQKIVDLHVKPTSSLFVDSEYPVPISINTFNNSQANWPAIYQALEVCTRINLLDPNDENKKKALHLIETCMIPGVSWQIQYKISECLLQLRKNSLGEINQQVEELGKKHQSQVYQDDKHGHHIQNSLKTFQEIQKANEERKNLFYEK